MRILCSEESPSESSQKKSKLFEQKNGACCVRFSSLIYYNRAEWEKNFVEQFYEKDTDIMYALDRQWLKEYIHFIQKDPSTEIGPIDNSRGMKYVHGKDRQKYYLLINEIFWRFVFALYGGGPVILCKDGEFIVEEGKLEYDTPSDSMSMSTTTSMSRSLKLTPEPKPATVISKASSYKPVGLVNGYFYCYLNAVLQCVSNLPSFYEALNENKKSYKLAKGGKWTKAFSELAAAVNCSTSSYDAKTIKSLAKSTFRSDEQHDSHEFMRFMLSNIQDEVNPTSIGSKRKEMNFPDAFSAWSFYKKSHYSCVDDIFAGQIESKVHCKSCKGVSTTFDPILDFSLPLLSRSDALEDCLDNFFAEEELPDTYRCEKCKKTTRAVKRVLVSRLPQVLVLHLKRFKSYPRQSKISDHIRFPVDEFTFKK